MTNVTRLPLSPRKRAEIRKKQRESICENFMVRLLPASMRNDYKLSLADADGYLVTFAAIDENPFTARQAASILERKGVVVPPILYTSPSTFKVRLVKGWRKHLEA